MKAKVFCFASAKGGSGKTIITANIATFLSNLGKKCLIIDCDAATHGMTLLYLPEVSKAGDRKSKGLFDASESEDSIDIIRESVVPLKNGVSLLPATYRFQANFDPEEKFSECMLSHIISSLREEYDYILLDAQAGSDKYSRLAMRKDVSDEVIIVSEYDPLSAAGIERLKQVAGEDLDYTRTWVLLNKMLPEFVDKFSEFLSVTKYLPPIPWNADVVRAYAGRKLALDVEKGNVYTLAIMRAATALLGDEIHEEINSWSKERAFAIKEPIERQYQNAEKELTFAIKSMHDLDLTKRRKKLIRTYILVLPLILIPYLLFNILDTSIFSRYLDALGKFDVVTLMAIGAFLTLPVLQQVSSRFLDSSETTESFRYKRRIEVLEEKLKQLEALKSADLETIIKSNSNL